jgi:peroxiredoxin Q/BCP
MRSEPLYWFQMAFVVVTLNACQRHSQTGLLAPGLRPPDLSGVDQEGKVHSLRESLGQFTVVCFYPKDDTPGCTKEACAFRDVWNQYRQAQVQLYGVSVDDLNSHASFAKKYALPFPIIADWKAQWVKAFGVPTMLGKATRVSFLLSPDGRVNKVYPNVDPGTHANLVLADMRSQIH